MKTKKKDTMWFSGWFLTSVISEVAGYAYIGRLRRKKAQIIYPWSSARGPGAALWGTKAFQISCR